MSTLKVSLVFKSALGTRPFPLQLAVGHAQKTALGERLFHNRQNIIFDMNASVNWRPLQMKKCVRWSLLALGPYRIPLAQLTMQWL